MKIGDLVVDDKSHVDPSNWFYDAFYRVGVVMNIGDEVEVLWTNKKGHWKTHEPSRSLVVISEGG